MKTAELTGADLDYWVAKAEGRPADVPFAPSTDWSDGGPIIEREKITIVATTGVHGDAALEWSAQVGAFSHYIDESLPFRRFEEAKSSTPLVAAMRAYVSSVFGQDVDATA